ncbi:MAG: autotransporter assembly complex protein TamA [Ottowia sp.]
MRPPYLFSRFSPSISPRSAPLAAALLAALPALLAPPAPAWGQPPQSAPAAPADTAKIESEKAGEAEAPPSFSIEVQADVSELQKLLAEHNELRRYQQVSDLDTAELDRLMKLAEPQLKALLAAQGYFTPELRITRESRPPAAPVVKVDVKAGPQAQVQAVTIAFAGDVAHSDDPAARRQQRRIREAWSLAEGSAFSQEEWSSAKSDALRQLIAQRYPAGRISRSAADVDEAEHRVRLGVTLDSGPLYLMGPAQVSGQQRYPAVLAERLTQLRVGEPYDQSRLADAQQRLISSGYYDAAYVTIETKDAETKDAETGDGETGAGEGDAVADAPAASEAPEPVHAPLHIQVTEAKLQKVTLGLGFTTDGGPRLTAEHTHNRLPWLGWRAVSKLQLEKANTFIETDWLAMPDAGGWRWGALARVSRVKDEGSFTTYNRQLRFGRARSDERFDRNIYVRYDLSRVKGADGRLITDEQAGDGSALSANYVWTTRRFNNRSDPTRGWGLGFEVGGGLTIEGKRKPFTRGVLRWMGFFPLGQSAASSRLAVRAEGGAVVTPGGARVPSALLFRAGGDNSVRGYAWRDIGVRRNGITAPGNYMFTVSAEWQRPLLKADGQPTGMEHIVFVDAGDVADVAGHLRPRVGVGSGVRVKTPIGPMSAALAYGLKPRKFRLHLSVGFVF